MCSFVHDRYAFMNRSPALESCSVSNLLFDAFEILKPVFKTAKADVESTKDFV